MSSSPFLRVLVATPLILASLSCGKKHEEKPAGQNPSPTFGLWQNDADKQRWIEKLSRTLRNGKEPTPEESFLQLKPESDIVDYMMADPSFVMSVLDFNMHFLGFRSEKLKLPDSSPGESFLSDNKEFYSNYSSAIESAFNVQNSGDFLSILEMGSTVFIPPLKSGIIKFGNFDFDYDEFRKQMFTSQDNAIAKLTEIANGTREKKLFCEQKNELDSASPFDSTLLISIWRWARSPIETFCPEESEPGNDETPAPEEPLPESVIGMVEELKSRYKKVRELHEVIHKDNYKPKSLSEIKFMDLTEYGLSETGIKLNASRWFWTNFRNSSTNMNRKRAAYVLKRYFCDDLTPIGIEVPEAHANGDRHATDPGCQSCHYKLDPMAGFFRNNGYEGNSYEKSPIIVFDDFASKDLKDYVKQWRHPDDSGWNVGYIRSVTSPELNDMPNGDPSVNDLFALIKRAPEVKQCLVRNLFHYLVGEEVTLDGGYLNELTSEFVKNAEENSSEALKKSIKKIALSNSFIQPSPAKGICYDYPEGYKSDDKPPCEIAYVLKESCQQCHSATNNQGGLDLESWSKGSGFNHVDESGNKVSLSDTLARISERLSSPDTKKRMPLAKFMSTHDRETLYKWVHAEASKL
jgi:hypothetical protein